MDSIRRRHYPPPPYGAILCTGAVVAWSAIRKRGVSRPRRDKGKSAMIWMGIVVAVIFLGAIAMMGVDEVSNDGDA